MDIEKFKKEFIKLKKEELAYLDNIAKLGYQKTFSQEEKLNIYRKLKFYENENARFYKLLSDILYESKEKNMDKVFIEIKLKDDFFNEVSDIFNRHRYLILRRYNINLENNSYILTVKDIIDGNYTKYRYSDFDYLFNKQELFEKPIYIFLYYDDHSDECLLPSDWNLFDYSTGIYIDFVYGDKKEISIKKMENFEKGKIIIRVTPRVDELEVRTIFREELLNENNKTLVNINILTGKKNQIRVAMQSINHPIYGDKKYGKKDGMRNLCLHAYKVIFTHPITKEKIVIEAKMPKYMNIKKES